MEEYEAILQGKQAPQVIGRFEYCDQFGDYNCRQFGLFWQGPPFNAFFESDEIDCAFMYRYPPKTIPGETYLLPCEQPDERDARQAQEHAEMTKNAAAASPAPSPTGK